MGHNRMVFVGRKVNYGNLQAVIVSENADSNSPEPQEGEIMLKYRSCVHIGPDDLNVHLSSASLLVQGSDVGVVFKASDGTNLVRAKQLLNHILKMLSLQNSKPVFSLEVRREGGGESDSGDEDVPIDEEIPSGFSDYDIGAVQLLSDDVWKNYARCTASSFSNGPGKLFMHYLGKFLSQCVKGGRYESNLSTCAGGLGAASSKDMQPGSSDLHCQVHHE